ncbi:MAG: ABC transporter involved in cytochrome c biogenesis, ATPase component CcmA [Rhodanobacteraceae bacterium]|jgi:heme exporter protein A|nr:MAG: ABC transporter involved in cytochrome c biogenesis, ATPase component CcmA [Rhodanobacteraceae bacterium]
MTSPTAIPAPLLSAHQLAFSRNDEPVFGPLDFSIGRGETVLVEGDNGSGKTTLLRVLAGMLPASSGDIRFDGHPASRDVRNGRVLWLGHRIGMNESLSARENLDFLAGLYGARAGMTAAAAMERVGIAAWIDEPLRTLSAGQKKRVALARLLLSPGDLWLLDEPYANLDRHGIDLVNALIAEHCSGGGGALVTSHGAVRFADPNARHIHLVA